MKNLFYLSMLVLTAGLTACASDEPTETRSFQYAGRSGCGETVVAEQPKPAPVVEQVQYQPTVVQAPVAQNCGGCQAREYTVRTPVKVVYRNTTYRTVYEPRTFETTSYETRPYNRAEVCESGNCGQPALVSQRAM